MIREGIGENSAFSGFHPIVNLAWYALVIGITVFISSPFFLLATFLMAWLYSLILRGSSIVRMNLIFIFWIVVVMAIVNVFFTHDGETVLTYLHGNRITLEALIYGVSAAVMLSSILIWFTSFNVIVQAEKLIYIFGRTAPVLGLTLSMIFRYIPLLKERYQEISMGQKCLGREDLKKGEKATLPTRIKRIGSNASILTSWSLESSIESADSMEARGYGLKGRSSFHLYRFDRRDLIAMIWFLVIGGVCIAGILLGKMQVIFYPVYVVKEFDPLTGLIFAAFLLLLGTPAAMDVMGELRWKRSDLTT